MILGLEVVFALIAAVLSVLSYRTISAIKHLGVGKSFWVPVFLSSIVFWAGSAVAILFEMGFSLVPQVIEVGQVSRILALCILVGGIYSYSRKVKGSLKEDFAIPEQLYVERRAVESLEGSISGQEPFASKLEAQRPEMEKTSKREPAHSCKHQVGYLGTLPKNASIPDECLRCDRIIECKHSMVKTLEDRVNTA